MTNQVKVAVLLLVKHGELFVELRPQLASRGGRTGLGDIEPGLHAITENLTELHRGVVGFDQAFQLVDVQVREVTDTTLPTTAEVVEILLAALAPSWDDDEPIAAASTPQQALEVMVVGALPGASPAFVEKHALYSVKEFLAHQRIMSALVLHAVVGNVAEVVGSDNV
ncbi:MAG TPA: hypothetical protein VFQ44_25290 [Streptosporangiaceae bacterium]|nr:hypothetical protein [Streptosporangiaceae bacterium]